MTVTIENTKDGMLLECKVNSFAIPKYPLDHHDKVKKPRFDIFVVGDDRVDKYDCLEEQGVTVVYTPYGRGCPPTSLKQKIATSYEKLRKRADSLLPNDAI